jgi:hypothetical protein
VWDVFLQKRFYPLDEWMGLKVYQKVSAGLKEEVIEQCVLRPYAQATKILNQKSGLKRSVMSNWKLIQGEANRERDLLVKVPDWRGRPLPVLKPDSVDRCPMLGVDPDATYVRSRRKIDKKHEIKMAVMYTSRKAQGSKRWKLCGKQVVLKVNDSVESLFNEVTQKAVVEYGLHGGSRVVAHGDGDPWIKRFGQEYCPQALNRLDPWHVFKKIREATGLQKLPEDWYTDFYTNPSSLIEKIETLERELAEPEEQERLRQLIGYLKNNREGMEPSGIGKEIKEKFPRMYKRGSGAIESNIFQVICQRFKGARMLWSGAGLESLSFLRQRYLNRSFDFEKVTIPNNQYRATDSMKELRDFVKEELC